MSFHFCPLALVLFSFQMMNLQQLKESLTQVINGTATTFRLCSLAQQLNCDIVRETNISRQRRVVQHELLKHIIREDPSDKYKELLEETSNWLYMKKEDGYPCTFSGCLFVGKRHQGYLSHLKKIHYINNKFICNYGRSTNVPNRCKQVFRSIESLQEHVKKIHSKSRTVNDDLVVTTDNFGSYQCSLESCGHKKFTSLQKLMTHFNSKDHTLETRNCPFENCNKVFKSQERNGRDHFNREHKKKNKLSLRAELISVPVTLAHDADFCATEDENVSTGNNSSSPIRDDELSEGDGPCDEELDEGEEEETLLSFNRVFADFLNRLSFTFMVPQTTIDLILDEFTKIAIRAQDSRRLNIVKKLRSLNVSEEIICEVVKINQNDRMINAQKTFDSSFKRQKFMETHFKYNKPKEIVLNPNEIKEGKPKECYHYISIIDGLRNLLEDPTFVAVMEKARNSEVDPDIVCNFTDGTLVKSLPYLQANPGAYSLGLYSDGIEVSNPLGQAKGRHKIVQLCWVVLDLPTRYRSQIDTINVGVIVREKLLKKYGYQRIYRPLIDDLEHLEKVGVVVSYPFVRNVKATMVAHLGDNLEQHNIGGFRGSFSSGDICRTCLVQHRELNEKCHDFTKHGPNQYWSVAMYDQIISQIDVPDDACNETLREMVTDDNLFDEQAEPNVEQQVMVLEYDRGDDTDEEEEGDVDEEDSDRHGLRYNSPFNRLASFHSTYSLPPDSMHDLCEGAIPEDLLSIIKILIHKKFFSQNQYNDALKKVYFKNDKPEQINIKGNKLKGKALSILNHLRHFGFILDKLNPSEEMLSDSSLDLFEKLSMIADYLSAPKLRNFEIATLEETVISYLNLRKEIAEEFPNIFNRPKPKHHYLTHFPGSIKKYGPASNYWTARFESKHRVCKSLCNSSKNFKNITKTLAERQQLRQCSTFYHGMFQPEDYLLPESVKRKTDLIGVEGSELEKKLIEFMDEDSILCSEITFLGQLYKVDDVIVLDSSSPDDLKVGSIQSIVVKNNTVFFIIYQYMAFRIEKLRIFQTQDFDETLHFFLAKNLWDYKPLIRKGSLKKFRFATHHYISVNVL